MAPRLPQQLALTILTRLEAATSRLEDMVPTIGDPALAANCDLSNGDQGMTAAEGMAQARGVPPTPQKQLETLPPAIDDFDGIINGEVKTFVNMSEEIGGLVAEQVQALHNHGALVSNLC